MHEKANVGRLVSVNYNALFNNLCSLSVLPDLVDDLALEALDFGVGRVDEPLHGINPDSRLINDSQRGRNVLSSGGLSAFCCGRLEVLTSARPSARWPNLVIRHLDRGGFPELVAGYSRGLWALGVGLTLL